MADRTDQSAPTASSKAQAAARRTNIEPASRLELFRELLAKPVSGASLGMLRISMGLLMMLEAWALCRSNPAAISLGTSPIETYYAGSKFAFSFPYSGFEWLPLLPTSWMYGLAGLMALAGLFLALGLRSRESSAVVFLIWAYFFVVESTRSYWQSHYYLELLFTFLLVWMPHGQRYSLDALLARRRGRPWKQTVPFWTVFVLRGQLVIAYFYAGVAKLSWDWLADAVPVRWFLSDPGVTKPYEALLSPAHVEQMRAWLQSEWFAYFISYVGLIFDLGVGFLFLFRRTRLFALASMFIFHGTNHFLIFDDIDWFPLAGATTALIFLDTDWPERVAAWWRRPRFGRPDWGWLVGGGIAFPVVGALLGWRIKKVPLLPSAAAESHTLGRLTVPLVVGWLMLQSLLPLRHYMIPGDGRFTYEGLSFSWRLKADRHSARGAIIVVRDEQILNTGPGGDGRIHWNNWRGDPVLYRRVTPGRIDWAQLGEIVVTLQPLVGTRVFFNPYAAGGTSISEPAARRRVDQIWSTLHGKAPAQATTVMGLQETCTRAASLLAHAGYAEESSAFREFEPAAEAIDQHQLDPAPAARLAGQLRNLLRRVLQYEKVQQDLRALLLQTGPFALDGEPRLPAHFLLIHDSRLSSLEEQPARTIDFASWKNGSATQGRDARNFASGTTQPLVIYTSDLGNEAGTLLPQAFLLDIHGVSQPPAIYWNSLKDLSPSKSIHISNQAFFLRRYARRVADLWEADYGRRPVVNALTAVSLNGRPHQELVDPNADLASVPVTWFGHNEWIRDLQLERIPREVVHPPKEP